MQDSPNSSSIDRRFWLEHVRGAGLVALLVVLPIVQLFVPRVGPFLGAIALLFCAIAHIFSAPKYRWAGSEPLSPAAGLILICVGFSIFWAALSATWGHDPVRGLDDLVSVCLALVAGWFLAHHFALIPHQRLPIVILIGLCIGSIALLVGHANFETIRQWRGDHFITSDFNRIATSLVILGPLLFIVAVRSKVYFLFSVMILLAIFLSVFRSESESAKIALVSAAMVGLFVLLLPSARIALTTAIALVFFAMPFLIDLISQISNFLGESIYYNGNVPHRLAIWSGYSEQLSGHFWRGWGMRSDIYVGTLEETQRYTKALGLGGAIVSPHNASIQSWINIGLIGTLPIAFVIALIGFLNISDRWIAAACTSMLTASVSILLTGSSAYQGWLISALATAGAVLWALNWRTSIENR